MRLRDDLIQAALIGLMHAIRVWDPSKAKLSTKAWPRMKYEVQKAIADATNLPRDILFAREPTDDELRNGIGRRKALDRARMQASTAFKFTSLDADAMPAEHDPDGPEGAFDRRRKLARLDAWLATLTPGERKAFRSGRPGRDLIARAKAALNDEPQKAKARARRQTPGPSPRRSTLPRSSKAIVAAAQRVDAEKAEHRKRTAA